MGSAVSSEVAAKVELLQAEGKSNEEICEALKSSGLVEDASVFEKGADDLAAEYQKSKESSLVELAPAAYASADEIVAAAAAQEVTGTLDLGRQGQNADGDPPGLLRQNGLPCLTAVPPQTFACACSTLVLKSNELTSLAGIEAMTGLLKLDASENQFKAVPEGLPPSLTELDLSENQIVDVPASIGTLVNLETLSLFKNAIGKLPDAMGQLVKLADFNIFNNKLIKIPPTMAECAALTHLNVGGNKIKTLPKTDKWTEMVEIKAHQNGVIMLPSLEKMNKLEVLKLDMNRALGSAPELGGPDGTIKCLLLWETSNCHLEALPDSLLHAHCLTTLNCSSNQLKTLPELQLPNLEILNVSSNDLSELPVELGLCMKLKTLFFSGNKITEVPSEYGALTSSIQRFNASGQKPNAIAMTPTLEKIRDACQKHDGRFMI